jgi:Xaa-Pro dipeptidase
MQMTTLTPDTLPQLQAILAETGIDGWLLFDFQRCNPIALGILGLRGMLTRRHLAYVPRTGVPVAITPMIEPAPWSAWPTAWGRIRYTTRGELTAAVATLVGGQRIAMEYSPEGAVPYLDRVPSGAVEMARAAGATVVSSSDLVTRFHAVWNAAQLAGHRQSAEVIAHLARSAFPWVSSERAAGRPVTEHGIQAWIIERIAAAGLEYDYPPIVAAGAHTADVHYEPSAQRPRVVAPGDVLLIDLWARYPDGVYADQTWMGSIGEPTDRMRTIWAAVRDSRDAVIAFLEARVEGGVIVRGGEAHDVARAVLVERGLGQWAIGRTGHSIDTRNLHGAGPNIDNTETAETRVLIAGLGFSIEPGLYIDGEFGMRSEVNASIGDRELIITPREYQHELIVV